MEERRYQVIEFLHGMVERDSGTVCEVLLDWSHGVNSPSEQMVADICAFLDQYAGVPLGQINFRDMMNILRAARRGALRVHIDIAQLL